MTRTTPPTITPLRLDGPQARYYLITGAVASTSLAPTRVELEASTTYDITDLIAPGGLVGFDTGVEKSQVPRFGSTKAPQTASGPRTANANMQLVTKASENGVDIRDFVDVGDTVHLAVFPGGDVAGNFAQVYKFKVAHQFPGTDTGDFQRITTDFNFIDSNERALIPDISDWTVQITGSPTGGTFTLTVVKATSGASETTAAIAYDANAGAVESALVALTIVNPGDVQVTGTTTKTCTWQYQVTMSGTSSLTGGTSPAVVVTEVP